MTKCDLVIVNYASAASTFEAVESVKTNLGSNLGRIIIVENGTGEGQVFRDAGYETVEFNENRGFAAGVNAGVSHSVSEFFLILNPDAVLLEGPWQELLAHDPTMIGAVGPRVISKDGGIQPSIYGEPKPNGVLLELLGAQRSVRKAGFRRSMPAFRCEAIGLQGSCLLITREAWNAVGPFDEDFFLYHEEIDWCLRARDKGYRNIYDPSVSIVHAGGLDVPPGRETVYYRGAVRLVQKRYGAEAGDDLRRRLRVIARLKGMKELMESL